MPLNFIIKILRASAKFHRSLKEHYKNWRPRQVKNVFKSWICIAILGNFFRILPLNKRTNPWPVTSKTISVTTEPSPQKWKWKLKWTLNLKSESARKLKSEKIIIIPLKTPLIENSPKFFSKLTPTVFFKTFSSVFFKTNTCLFQDFFQLF